MICQILGGRLAPSATDALGTKYIPNVVGLFSFTPTLTFEITRVVAPELYTSNMRPVKNEGAASTPAAGARTDAAQDGEGVCSVARRRGAGNGVIRNARRLGITADGPSVSLGSQSAARFAMHAGSEKAASSRRMKEPAGQARASQKPVSKLENEFPARSNDRSVCSAASEAGMVPDRRFEARDLDEET